MDDSAIFRINHRGHPSPFIIWGNPRKVSICLSAFSLSASAASLLDNGLHAARDLGRLPLTAARGPAQALPPGHGGIVEAGGRKMGVYKTAEGTLYAVDPRCPHMGCQLEWNPDEESWDCPCHGSRFEADGRLIEGPATGGLRNH